jgi:PAS domain S-box-containing protein
MKSDTMSVLLIERDNTNTSCFGDVVSASGITRLEMKRVGDLSEALRHIAVEFVDIIVLDLDIPSTEDFDALKELRRAAETMPIVVLANSEDPLTAGKALLEGAQQYLPKREINRDFIAQVLGVADYRSRLNTVTEIAPESLLRLTRAIEQIGDAVVVTDTAGMIEYVNPAFEEITGYTREEVVGQTPRLLKSTAHDDQFYRDLWNTVLHGKTFRAEFVNKRKDGSVYYEEKTITPVKDSTGRITHFIATGKDITERKEAEEELRKMAGTLQAIIEASPLAILTLDTNMTVRAWNPAAERIFGWRRIEVIGKPNPVICDEELRDLIDKALRNEMMGSLSVKRERKDGRLIDVTISPSPLRDTEGQFCGLMALIEDITEKKQADEERARMQEALRRSERQLSLIAANALDAIFALDLSGQVTYVNPAIEERTGYKVDEVYEKGLCVFAHPDDQPKLKQLWKRLVEGHECPDEEFRIVTKEGKTKWCSGSWGPLFDERAVQVGVQGYMRDISEHKTLQAQFLQSQKMEAVGRLAGGVAHDFNNLLTAIIGYSQIVLSQLEEADPMHERIQEVLKAGLRGSSLTRQLLAFSRKQVLQPAVLDLNTLLDDLNKMLRRLIGEDTELLLILEPDLGRVKADPGQIEQVIMNLAVNARDAMPQGGRLIVETKNIEINEGFVLEPVGLNAGRYVMLSVTDTGCGMDQETIEHIYEPFFTTKEMGKGTGLGLSTVYGIVIQSDGKIVVDSEEGKGTRFRIYLPRVDDPAELLNVRSSSMAGDRGNETILVVEDDELLRKLASDILSITGYNVLQAANAGEALLHCERFEGPIQLMITDVVMPQMSGRELSERVELIRREMKVLFMSGYTDDAVVRHGITSAGRPFIQKPFSPADLARKVRDVLDKE